jgi:hypothetical protein
VRTNLHLYCAVGGGFLCRGKPDTLAQLPANLPKK